MNTTLNKAQHQFSNDDLKEIRELLLVASTSARNHPNNYWNLTAASGMTIVACDKHIQTINQILADRSK